MNFNEDVTCQMCNLVLEYTVTLPCGCWICNQHVTDQLVANKNAIESISCNKTHQIPLEGFIVNKMANKLIEQELFLTDDEKLLKKSMG